MLDAQLQDLIARIAVPGVLGVAGLITLSQYWITRRRHAWPKTTGTVRLVEVASGPQPGKRSGRVVFWPKVQVAYRVGEKEYLVERITHMPIYYPSEEAARVVAEAFHVGEEASVFYRPDRAEEAYLVPGGAVGGRLLLVLGLLLIIVDAAWTYLLFTSA